MSDRQLAAFQHSRAYQQCLGTFGGLAAQACFGGGCTVWPSGLNRYRANPFGEPTVKEKMTQELDNYLKDWRD